RQVAVAREEARHRFREVRQAVDLVDYNHRREWLAFRRLRQIGRHRVLTARIGEVFGHNVAFAGARLPNQPRAEAQFFESFAGGHRSAGSEYHLLNEGPAVDGSAAISLGKLE